jgi:hypothetical protein
MRRIVIDRAGRGALESAWVPTPGWKRARVRIEAGLGGDLGVRVRGCRSPGLTMGGPPAFELATLEPLAEVGEFDLDGAAAVQLIADVGRGRLVRVSLEEVCDA